MGAYYIKYVFLNLINMISGVVLFPIYFYSCKKNACKFLFKKFAGAGFLRQYLILLIPCCLPNVFKSSLSRYCFLMNLHYTFTKRSN